jgi:hypothetical protein
MGKSPCLGGRAWASHFGLRRLLISRQPLSKNIERRQVADNNEDLSACYCRREFARIG